MSILTFLGACSAGINGDNYLDMQPTFKLEDYFNGPIKVWGIVQDRSGNVVNRFDADMVGRWEGDEGVLDEVFTYYDSGKIQRRKWEITKIDELHYQGKAGDIIGIAAGTAHGNAIYWTYEMDVPVRDTSYRLKFDDWMWAMNDGVVVNRSYMKKFGIRVAELTIFMQKQ
ncbi:MAG: DUF3833 domain-containing protein [Gammaproteobacteria bacterium]|nr:DUF3833 domain-containing protein [Gammaproteobacteria bacterium]MCY4211070.1 DUF3833 domain-containing protein [Gammaproteobacteria bacterium]MCY4281347.1 DUF3833 domain-containing protein [Gammaproteobacteria bacterium]MCY4338271.1 DUF3833 domain-containing protein [Gammaproteobacteria bacterium]